MNKLKTLILTFVMVSIFPLVSNADSTRATFDAINSTLADRGLMISSIEWITDGASDEIGQTIFFNDVGNKMLPHDFVPGDPRSGGFTEIFNLTDLIDAATASGLTPLETTAAIERALDTWDSVPCSAIPITNIGGVPFDLGVVQNIFGFGGNPDAFAHMTHAGWLPGAFFDVIEPGGSGFILGVTFTFIWLDGGLPTDIDNNGDIDVAFREIYYNDAFSWADDGVGHFDVETVALHESGHGLSQGHFGKAFRTNRNGKLHFSPRAVMNASYSGIQTSIAKSDKAGHCANWAQWPNK